MKNEEQKINEIFKKIEKFLENEKNALIQKTKIKREKLQKEIE